MHGHLHKNNVNLVVDMASHESYYTTYVCALQPLYKLCCTEVEGSFLCCWWVLLTAMTPYVIPFSCSFSSPGDYGLAAALLVVALAFECDRVAVVTLLILGQWLYGAVAAGFVVNPIDIAPVYAGKATDSKSFWIDIHDQCRSIWWHFYLRFLDKWTAN